MAILTGVIPNITNRAKHSLGRFLKELGLQLDRTGSQMSYDIAFQQKLSRAQQVIPLYEHRPDIRNAWVAPNATILGRVLISPWATIWYGAVLRAELNTIRIGHFSSVGDGTVMHSSVSMPVNVSPSINIGKNVTVGENCSIFPWIVDDDVKIGAKSVIGEGWIIERGAEIQSNSIVPPGRLIPAGQLWGGSPVRYVKDLSEDEKWSNYNESYSRSVQLEDSAADALWPQEYVKSLPAEAHSEQPIDEYVEENYFKKGLFR
jgi:carbonic anhydrase/acetyltransferase-like protein (isoleucine patch superfamily)